MNKAEQKRLGVTIERDLESLRKEIQALERQLQPIAPDCSLGELLRSEMMQGQEVLNLAYVEAKKRYNRLLYAQKHIEDEGYGLCVDCEEPIAFERLLLIPEARYCIRCAKERDL